LTVDGACALALGAEAAPLDSESRLAL